MYRMTANHKRTASINPKTNQVVAMSDDGWEDILDYRMDFASQAEAAAYLVGAGYEEYDPNAALKAMGMVFINGCYRMPA